MKKWLTGAAGAVVVACAAIGIPLWLEAGTSSTNTATGTQLTASFQSTDPATGAVFSGYVSAQAVTQTYSSHTTGPGNSSRAGSSRAGGGEQTFTYSYVNVSGQLFSQQGDFIAQGSGYGTPSTLSVASDLSTGQLVAQVDVDIYGPLGFLGRFPIAINLNFVAIGGLQRSRDAGQTHIQSPRALYQTRQTSSQRNAQATGSAILLGNDLAADGSTYASIGQFDSTFRAQN